MGQTFHLVCIDCNKSLWLGQNSLGCDDYLYSRIDKKLSEFLFEHYMVEHYNEIHHLQFVELNDLPVDCVDMDAQEK